MQTIKRDENAPENPRASFVQKVIGQVEDDIKHWEPDFKRMKRNRAFARGLQWEGEKHRDLSDPDRRYVENVTLRHLKQSTSSIYARNPQFVWRRSKRMYHKIWDGSATMLQHSMAMLAQDPMGATPGGAMANMVMREAAAYAEESKRVERIGETLAILYQHSLREQTQPFKAMMKRLVMTSKTCGVAYVKQTFQRVMTSTPDVERQINDAKSQLEIINRLTQDIAAGEIDENDGEVDRLKGLLESLEGAEQILLREGLALDYPDPLNIIPGRDVTYLPTFLGCTRVTERYYLTPERIKEVYGVDLGPKYSPYRLDANRETVAGGHTDSDCMACVFETYDKADGKVYVTCDGHPDFLREPEEPFPWTERFWPWFVYSPNWNADPEHPFAPSDVELIECAQMEINRAGEGLRQHRWAARPGSVTSLGMMDEADKTRVTNRAPHELVPLKGLEPGADVRQAIQPFPTSPIDPNLYDTSPAMQAILRVAGTAEANLGPTSNSTATEASFAQASRATSDDSSIDELDDLLSEMARAGGQILLENVTAETVMNIVGPGALWPEMGREQIAKEIYLEVEAGSSGRKNQAHEVQTWTQMFPLMSQIPGYSAERMAKHLLAVIDPRLSAEDWLEAGAPSITALNGQMQAQANNGTADPAAQGPEGASNAPTPEPAAPLGPKEPSPGQTIQ